MWMKSKQNPLQIHPTIQTDYTHNKGTGPVWPSLPSRLAQWTARSLSSLPVMQRSCLLLRRAAMLSEWKPGVSERNWGRNPRPSTLSAGEYRLLACRGSAGRCLSTHRWGYCCNGGSDRGVKRRISRGWSGCLPFCCLPPSSRCVGLPLQTALGPLLASASRGPVGLQGRQTGRDPRVVTNNKMVMLRDRCRCFKHYVEPVFGHRFSPGWACVGRPCYCW